MSTDFVRSKRSIPDHMRTRAVFSCDRCKIKKRKCKRLAENELKYDVEVPCVQCQKAEVECTTTIKRKKRNDMNEGEMSGYHYACILEVMKDVFPNVDVSNVSAVKALAKQRGVNIPERSQRHEFIEVVMPPWNDETSNTKEQYTPDSDGRVNTVQTSMKSSPSNVLPIEHLVTSRNPTQLPSTTFSTWSPQNSSSSRPILEDNTPLYFSSLGTSSIYSDIWNIAFQGANKTQNIDSGVSSLEKQRRCDSLLDNREMPSSALVIPINRKEASIYFEVFLKRVHPYYLVFNENVFKEKFNQFFKEIGTPEDTHPEEGKLSLSWICCIYLSWIFGKAFQNEVVENAELTPELEHKYFNIIKLALLDLILNPTLNGLQLLYLYAGYLFCNENKDAAWILYGLAIRQSLSLGLHKKSTLVSYSQEEQETRKRIWWALFKIDVYSACSYGRVKSVSNEEINVPLPVLSSFKDPTFGKYYVQTIILAHRMNHILEIRNRWYSEDLLHKLNLSEILKMMKSIQKVVANYPDELKDFASYPVTRYKPKLHIQHNYYYILLSLPVLVKVMKSKANLSRIEQCINEILYIGLDASLKMSSVVDFLSKNTLFNGKYYFDFFYGFCASMFLIVGLFFLQNGYSFVNFMGNEKLDSRLLLDAIRKIRDVTKKHAVEGTMKNVHNAFELFLDKLGILHYFDESSSNSDQFTQPNVSSANFDFAVSSQIFTSFPNFLPQESGSEMPGVSNSFLESNISSLHYSNSSGGKEKASSYSNSNVSLHSETQVGPHVDGLPVNSVNFVPKLPSHNNTEASHLGALSSINSQFPSINVQPLARVPLSAPPQEHPSSLNVLNPSTAHTGALPPNIYDQNMSSELISMLFGEGWFDPINNGGWDISH